MAKENGPLHDTAQAHPSRRGGASFVSGIARLVAMLLCGCIFPLSRKKPLAQRWRLFQFSWSKRNCWLSHCVCLLLVPLVAGCSSGQSGREKGVQEATAAIAAGQLTLREYPPLPSPPGHQEYVQLLRERCGVEYEVCKLPSGVSKDVFIQEVRGWNDTMKTEIARQFGAGIFDELEEAAQERWNGGIRPKD